MLQFFKVLLLCSIKSNGLCNLLLFCFDTFSAGMASRITFEIKPAPGRCHLRFKIVVNRDENGKLPLMVTRTNSDNGNITGVQDNDRRLTAFRS